MGNKDQYGNDMGYNNGWDQNSTETGMNNGYNQQQNWGPVMNTEAICCM